LKITPNIIQLNAEDLLNMLMNLMKKEKELFKKDLLLKEIWIFNNLKSMIKSEKLKIFKKKSESWKKIIKKVYKKLNNTMKS
jgi:hypothetical protein